MLLAVMAAALMLFAGFAVLAGQFVAAGMSLLTSSFIIFYRETRL